MDLFVQEHSQRIAEAYAKQAEAHMKVLSGLASDSVRDYCSGLIAAVSPSMDVKPLMQKKHMLDSLLHNNA
ncbi:hypothetical protein D3C73_1600070 [compost metagenome]